MKTHLETKRLELQQTPIILHIARENGKGKLGRAVIREASIIWYPGFGQKGHKISWARFAKFIEKQVPKRRRRKLRGK
jgi:hypothetical protein